MATRDELIRLYGERQVVRLDAEAATVQGVGSVEAHLLTEVGLPRSVESVFALELWQEPAAFAPVTVSVEGQQVRLLCLGCRPGEQDVRYCLDLLRGYVVLLTVRGEPKAELVNTGLAQFVEFLYRWTLRSEELKGASKEQAAAYGEQLLTYLRHRDAHALRSGGPWHAMFDIPDFAPGPTSTGQALALARRDFRPLRADGSPADVHVKEFDLGFLVYAEYPPNDPPSYGASNVVVTKQGGEIVYVPAVPPDSAIELYRYHFAPDQDQQ